MKDNWLFIAFEVLIDPGLHPIMIACIVDDIICKVRFPEWQATNAGERLQVQQDGGGKKDRDVVSEFVESEF